MPAATIERARRDAAAACDLINAYGATETTSPTTLMPPGRNRAHADSVGLAVPCGDVI